MCGKKKKKEKKERLWYDLKIIIFRTIGIIWCGRYQTVLVGWKFEDATCAQKPENDMTLRICSDSTVQAWILCVDTKMHAFIPESQNSLQRYSRIKAFKNSSVKRRLLTSSPTLTRYRALRAHARALWLRVDKLKQSHWHGSTTLIWCCMACVLLVVDKKMAPPLDWLIDWLTRFMFFLHLIKSDPNP